MKAKDLYNIIKEYKREIMCINSQFDITLIFTDKPLIDKAKVTNRKLYKCKQEYNTMFITLMHCSILNKNQFTYLTNKIDYIYMTNIR